MDVLWYVLLLALLLGSVLLTALDFPGTWIMVLAVFGYYHITHGHYLTWISLVTLCGMAIAAEVADWAVGSGAGAKRAGARWRGKLGGTLGGVLGGFFLTFLVPVPILGTIVGICAGCFLGALLLEMAGGRQADEALAIGASSAQGRLLGILVKIGFSIVILLFSIYAGFPHRWSKLATRSAPPATRSSAPATTRANG